MAIKSGLIITGDSTGSVRATALSEAALDKLAGTSQRTSRSLKDDAKNASASLDGLKSTIVGLGGAYVGFGAVQESLRAFAESDEAVGSLNATLENTGRVTSNLSATLQDYASDMQLVGVVSDDAIIKGDAFLALYSGISDDLLPRASKAIADLAAQNKGLNATTEDVTTAAKALGKAADGNFSALSKMGIVISDSAKDSDNFARVLTEVESKVGGVNEKLGNTATGGLVRFKNAAGDIYEEVGRIITIPLSGWAVEAIPDIRQVVDEIHNIGDYVEDGTAWEIAGTYINQWKATGTAAFGDIWAAITNPEAADLLVQEFKFVGAAIAELPINLKSFYVVAIGELDQFVTSMDAQEASLVSSAKLTWEDISYSASLMWLVIKQKGAEAVDSIILNLADLLQKANSTLANVDWFPGVEETQAKTAQAVASLKSYASNASKVKDEVSELATKHTAVTKALNEEAIAANKAAEDHIQASKDSIQATLDERDATIKNTDSEIDAIKKKHESIVASGDLGKSIKGVSAARDDDTESVGANSKATKNIVSDYEREIEALEKKKYELLGNSQAAYEASLANKKLTDTEKDDLIARHKVVEALKEQNEALKEQNRLIDEEMKDQWDRWVAGANEAAEAARNTAEEFNSISDRVSESLVDVFNSDSPREAAKRLIDDLKVEFANAVFSPIINYVVQGAGQLIGAASPAIQTASGGGGASSLMSGMGSMFGSAMVGIGDMLAGVGLTSLGSGMAISGGAMATGGLLSGGLSALSGAGSALMAGNIGGAVGMAIPVIGPLIAIAGALGAFDKLFESKSWTGYTFNSTQREDLPQFDPYYDTTVAGRPRFAVGESEISNFALGISRRGQLTEEQVVEFAEQHQSTIDAIVTLDNSLAALLDPEQLESVRIAAEVNAAKVEDLSVADFINDRYTAIFGAIGGAFDALFNSLSNDGADATTAATLVVSLATAIDAYSGSIEYAASQFDSSSNTIWESANKQAEDLIELATSFDGSVESTERLTAAIVQRYTTEQQLYAELSALKENVDASLSNSIQKYSEAGMSASALYESRYATLISLRDQLAQADDPTTEANIIAQIQSITGEVVSLGQQISQEFTQAFNQALFAIQAASESINATIDDQITKIKESQMTNEELYTSLKTQAEGLAATIVDITDPEQLNATVTEITNLVSRAYGLLTDDQQSFVQADGTTVAEQTVTFLDGVLGLAEQQLAVITDSVNEQYSDAPDVMTASDAADFLTSIQVTFDSKIADLFDKLTQTNNDLQTKLSDAMNRIAELYQQSAAAQENAAATQQNAAAMQLQAANTPLQIMLLDTGGGLS